MNQIGSLMSELCPHGVSYVTLDSLFNIRKGENLTNSQAVPGVYPVITASRGSTFTHNDFNFSGECITISSHGAYAGFVSYYNQGFWLGNNVYLFERNGEGVSTRFYFHVLKSLAQALLATVNTGGIPYINAKDLLKLRVPNPPIEIQHEIVNILDKFTNLEVELEAELEARKSQYEHYRNHLLSFQGVEPGEVRWIPIGDVCEYRKERSRSSTGKFLYVGVEDLLQERRGVSDQARIVSSTGHDIFMPGDVLLGNIRPYLKKVWRADVEGRTNGDVLVVTPRRKAITELDTSYLYFLLSSDDFFSYCVQTSKGAKMPRGDKKAILRYEIPVPSIEVQKQIAKSLALFEQLTQDMESGIPAEQTARRKQYEYYRSKLLTFNEMEVA